MGIKIIKYEKKINKDIYGVDKKKQYINFSLDKSNITKNYYNLLKRVLAQKNLEKYTDKIYYLILAVTIITGIYFISIKQLFLALLIPVSMLFFIKKIFLALMEDLDEKIEEQLPYVIDTIIRVFSKYGDLKSIIYETANLIEEPLASRFESLSRKLATENAEKAMLEFADKLNNVWIYSLVYILISYKEYAKKEDTINNLKHLRNMIEQENILKNSYLNDKKYSIVVNYVIIVITFIVGLLNILVNPVGKEFFFQTVKGLLCFIIGYASLFGTIILNIYMSKKRRKRV